MIKAGKVSNSYPEQLTLSLYEAIPTKMLDTYGAVRYQLIGLCIVFINTFYPPDIGVFTVGDVLFL